MKAPRPIGVLRLLAPILGRGRRRWRGGPLMPLIWRRRPRARPAPGERPVRPPSIFRSYAFNLNLVWPARPAAGASPAAPLRILETRTHEIVRAGRDAGTRETRRLVALVERLWLRSGMAEPSGAAASPATPARESAPPALPPPAAGMRPDPSVLSPHHAGQPAPSSVRAEGAPRLWPRVRTMAARAALTAPAGAAAAPPARDIASAPASAAPAGAGGPPGRPSGRTPAPRPPRAGAMRIFHESRMTGLAALGDPAASFPTRTPAATSLRGAEVRAGGSKASGSPRPRSRAALVWRRGDAGGESAGPAPVPFITRRTARTELVWRRLPAAPARDEAGIAPGAASAAAARSEVFVRADRPTLPPAAPAASATAALPPAEMGRLVDEVVRRLERIGRDERLRRGI